MTDAGHDSAGGVWSVTVIANEHIAVLPLLSVTVQVTLVVPRGKFVPGGGEHDTEQVDPLGVAGLPPPPVLQGQSADGSV